MDLAAIASLLRLSVQPAFVLDGGVVLALNSAAAELGLRSGMDAADFLRPSSLPDGEGNGELDGTVFGAPCRIRAAVEGGVRVVFLQLNEADPPKAENQFNALARTAGTMRQTLQSLLSSVEALAEFADLDRPTPARHAASALQGIYQLVRMADNLNVYSLLQQGAYPLQQTPQSIGALFRDLCEKARQLLRYDDISLDYRLPEKDSVGLLDAGLIRLAFWNLVANAAAHASDGKLSVRLLRDADRGFVLTVANRSEQALPEEQLFDRCRTEPTDPSAADGAGLGLGLVLQIARLHGGSLLLTSQQDGSFAAVLRLQAERASAETMSSPVLIPRRDLDEGLVGLSGVLPLTAYDPRDLL